MAEVVDSGSNISAIFIVLLQSFDGDWTADSISIIY